MIQTLKFINERYFSSIKVITLNLLEDIQNRVYPKSRKSYEELNHVEIGNNDTFIIPYRQLTKVGYTCQLVYQLQKDGQIIESKVAVSYDIMGF